ncbi:MAG: polysaccharide deacetylase family protein [Acetivibrio sp.]
MSFKKNKEDLCFFLSSGLLMLLGILFLGLGFHYLPNAVYTMKQNSERKLPIYCVECTSPKVALSFDAAWGNEDTPALLKILKENNVKATFFMTGGWIDSYPEDVKAIAFDGHDLANHSENHKQMSQLSKQECIREIIKPHEKVKALTGMEMNLFRPPYGDYNNTVLEAIEESGYYGIQWDVEVCVTNGNIEKSRFSLFF